MIFIFAFLLVVSCAPTRPEVKQSPSDIDDAGKVFEDAQQELDNEVAVIEDETDLTGVEGIKTGELKAIIPDPAIRNYKNSDQISVTNQAPQVIFKSRIYIVQLFYKDYIN